MTYSDEYIMARKREFLNEESAYEYWYDMIDQTGLFYEGLGISEDTKHDIFKDWLETVIVKDKKWQ